jgi:hypothetical protein
MFNNASVAAWPELHLPRPNQFIATNFELFAHSEPSESTQPLEADRCSCSQSIASGDGAVAKNDVIVVRIAIACSEVFTVESIIITSLFFCLIVA